MVVATKKAPAAKAKTAGGAAKPKTAKAQARTTTLIVPRETIVSMVRKGMADCFATKLSADELASIRILSNGPKWEISGAETAVKKAMAAMGNKGK
jgi:hypothetical protein